MGACRRGREGEGRGGESGRGRGCGEEGREGHQGAAAGVWSLLLRERKKAGKRRKKRKEEGKKKKENEKKEKFPYMGISREKKIIYEVGQKLFL
jgi:hypothetical protein